MTLNLHHALTDSLCLRGDVRGWTSLPDLATLSAIGAIHLEEYMMVAGVADPLKLSAKTVYRLAHGEGRSQPSRQVDQAFQEDGH